MTAAEILQSAQPPADDRIIEKAISDLDVKIWEWAEALKNAHTQLRSAFAVRAAVQPVSPRPEVAGTPDLRAAAAAAHIPSAPSLPAEWTAKPTGMPAEWTGAVPSAPAAPQPPPAWSPSHGGHGASFQDPKPGAAGAGIAASQGVSPADPAQPAGVMPWPTETSSWPAPGTPTVAIGPQEWPTWTPTDTSQDASSAASKKTGAGARGSRPVRPSRPAPAGPSPEERAQKAAAEEALLSELEDAIARRVRLLRRLDPDTPIEKLVEKAKQGQAEAAAAPAVKDVPSSSSSSSSWWRRK